MITWILVKNHNKYVCCLEFILWHVNCTSNRVFETCNILGICTSVVIPHCCEVFFISNVWQLQEKWTSSSYTNITLDLSNEYLKVSWCFVPLLTICAVTKELSLVKRKLLFIAHSGSNHNVFYLYTANSSGFFSTPFHTHAWLLKGFALSMVKSVSCSKYGSVSSIFFVRGEGKYDF